MATTTGLPLMTSINPAAKAETAADKCRRQGGKWDFKTQTCIMPKSEAKTTEPEQKQKDLSKLPTRTVTSREGVSAIQTPEETRRLQEEAAFRKSLGGGLSAAQALSAQEAEQARQLKLQETLSTLGDIDTVTGQEQSLDVSEALTAGVARDPAGIIRDAAIGAWAGATTGTTIGAATGGPIGAGAGAIGGAVAGIGVAVWRNIQGNIEDQQKGQIGANVERYNQGLRNLRQLALLATTYPEQADQLVADFNTQKSIMHQAYEDTKAETDEDLEKYLEDGTEILAKFEAALGENGMVDIYELRLNLALSRDTPMNDMALLDALDAAEIDL